MVKIRVGVLRGGPTSQYERSLKSGAAVLRTLGEKYHPVDIFVSKNGIWHTQGFERTPDKVLKNTDAVINTINGEYGEDGTLHEILESHAIPYIGSKKMASLLAWNKLLSKDIFKRNNIKTPLFEVINKEEFARNKTLSLFRNFPQPSVVKPISGSGSHKTKICFSYDEFQNAIKDILEDYEKALVEEYIPGKEVIATVLEDFRDKLHYVLPPFEVAKKGHATLQNEKINCEINGHCPSTLSVMEKKLIEEYAEEIHKLFGMRHTSKTDFIVNPKRGIYTLETNIQPDLYEDSSTDKALKAVGSNIQEALDHLIGNLAFSKK